MERRIIAIRRNNEVLLDSSGMTFPTIAETSIAPAGETFRPADDKEHIAFEPAEEFVIPSGAAFYGLREAYPQMSTEDYRLAVKSAELLHWDRESRYCSACGAKMERATEISKKCSSCGRELFPYVAPAIIVLVKRGESALLVHARTFRRDFYGLVAGFVETGESLEECVKREVKEETSLDITDLRYFGSQSWPFPSTLMIGFTAEYAGGELKFADDELDRGGFFTADNLPPVATPPSLARALIDAWVAETSGQRSDSQK